MTENAEEMLLIPLARLRVQERKNSRTTYEKIEELSQSIKEHGLITPLSVRRIEGDGKFDFELVAGYRRHRALKMAKIKEAMAIVKPLDDRGAAFLNVLENIERNDLHPADEARVYAEWESGEAFHVEGSDVKGEPMTKEEIGKKMGKSKTHVGNLIRAHKQLIPSAKIAWRKYKDATRFMFMLAAKTEEEQETLLEEFEAKKNSEKTYKNKSKKDEEDKEGGHGKKMTAKEIRDMMAVFEGQLEDAGLKGVAKAYLDGKIVALGFVQGSVSKRKASSVAYP